MFQSPKYRRVLLKLSGEILAGENGFGINPETISRIVDEIKDYVGDRGIVITTKAQNHGHILEK